MTPALLLVAAGCLAAAGPLPKAGISGPAQEGPRYQGMPTAFWVGELVATEPAARRKAVEALTVLGPDAAAAVPVLAEALQKDRDAEVRFGVLKALRAIGPKAAPAVPVLVRALRDRDVQFRTLAAAALGGIRSADPTVVSALVRVVTEDSEGGPRHAAVHALKESGPAAMKQALPTLLPFAKGVGIQRMDVIESLSAAGPDALPHLVALLGDPSGYAQAEAAGALKQFGPAAKAGVPALVAILKKWENGPGLCVYLTQNASEALAAIGADAVPALVEILADHTARARAHQALVAIGPAAVPALCQALSSPNPQVRKEAASALGEMGVKAKDAVPTLTKALRDSDLAVHLAAEDALKAIQPTKDAPGAGE